MSVVPKEQRARHLTAVTPAVAVAAQLGLVRCVCGSWRHQSEDACPSCQRPRPRPFVEATPIGDQVEVELAIARRRLEDRARFAAMCEVRAEADQQAALRRRLARRRVAFNLLCTVALFALLSVPLIVMAVSR